MTKQEIITEWLLTNSKQIIDFFLFIIMVVMGAIVKIINEVRKGAQTSWKWFLAEAIVSMFVAILVYGLFDQFLNFNKIFTYIVCAWCGSFSTIFHKKLEEIIGLTFEKIKKGISYFFDKFISSSNETKPNE